MGVFDNVETQIRNQTPEIPHFTSILYGFVLVAERFYDLQTISFLRLIKTIK